jgi:hypothetical protein
MRQVCYVLVFFIRQLLGYLEECNTTGCSTDEETGLAAQIGWNVSPRLSCPSPLARVQSFADSLTSVSVHAHIYKNTVKR